MIRHGVLAFLIGLMLPALVAAEPPRLALPLDCSPGEDCWVVNHYDHDPSPEARDYACGRATYDGHRGVDFAIRDKERMRLGVEVKAAAAGLVAGVRDGMNDGEFLEKGGDAVKGKECGNGVNVSTGDGWSVQYCHLLRNSIRVKKGDKVEAGTPLGLVGLSGMSEFPHVHLQVMRDKTYVDPFAGPEPVEGCGLGKGHLWLPELAERLAYKPTALYNAGFSPAAPKADSVRGGLHHDAVLPRQSPALVFWTDIFRVRAGDEVTIVITDPAGEEIIRHANTLDKDQARRLVYAGARRKGLFWPTGTYKGEAVLKRAGEEYRVRAEVVLK